MTVLAFEVAVVVLLLAASLVAFWHRKWLVWLANATLLYPVFTIGALYAHWFIAWRVLGHKPISMTDDPKFIVGIEWIHAMVGIALLSLLPMGVLALLSNAIYIVRERPSAPQAAIRACTLVSFWFGAFAWFQNDPHRVMDWWLD